MAMVPGWSEPSAKPCQDRPGSTTLSTPIPMVPVGYGQAGPEPLEPPEPEEPQADPEEPGSPVEPSVVSSSSPPPPASDPPAPAGAPLQARHWASHAAVSTGRIRGRR